ncbi:hypothetical protein NE857_34010 (plasmid) [Nocardiopsis exhalans]|uniref:Endonuclease n=1 Tax=Nocardiopsis exhalans TaxID=163604 RepID=A0ABY5DGS9_9ACTN|nr:hypothetical protein [Nocardiopsis exhalans]USY23549.1 hypothetical protein NE857_34010 [Nocardiopsis exhalans]
MTSRTDRLTTDDAVRILTARYPDLPAQAGTSAPHVFAALAVARLAADLSRSPAEEFAAAPVTRQELDAATVLISDAHTGIEHAEVILTAAQYVQDGVSWDDIAALRGHAGGATSQKRQSRLIERLGIPDTALPVAPTLPAHTKRARALVEAATTQEPASPYLAAQAAEVLGALLLAARYDQVTGADLRAWTADPAFAGAADGLAAAPREAAEAAHHVLAAAATLPEGTRGDINALVLAGIDQWDPPADAQDRP